MPSLSAIAPFGAYGPTAAQKAPGVVCTLREDLFVATLAARKGASTELARKVHEAFGITLPDGPRAVGTSDLAFIGTAPGRWIATSGTRPALADELAAVLGPHAAITEQSDANLVFDLSGERVRDLLAKGVALDLHPGIFKPGDAAATSVAHIAVTFWRSGAESYRFLVARSFAPAFSRFLVASAAEYGFHLESAYQPGRG